MITAADVAAYTVPTHAFPLMTDIRAAEDWVHDHVKADWPAAFPPPAVKEAAALLAAVFTCDPAAVKDESRVPNMVRLMLLPYC
jgi:hypothetical protein